MTCYYPLKGWRSRSTTDSGRRSVVFNPGSGFVDLPLELPCGKCIGCKLEYSRQWAVRGYHEASMHKSNVFITLTYAEAFVPSTGSLVPRDLQLFIKRVRKRLGPKVRFFACGEYGEENLRPHYHVCLFNCDFPDRELYRRTERGDYVYRSNILESLWNVGRSEFGEVTFESAAYVARYCIEKVTGDDANFVTADGCPGVYARVDAQSGEILQVVPEFVRMSLKPGIGATWFRKYESDVYPHDVVVIRGVKQRPPKYYDKLHFGDANYIRKRFPGLFSLMFDKDRVELLDDRVAAMSSSEDNTFDRLITRELCKLSQIKSLRRS